MSFLKFHCIVRFFKMEPFRDSLRHICPGQGDSPCDPLSFAPSYPLLPTDAKN